MQSLKAVPANMYINTRVNEKYISKQYKDKKAIPNISQQVSINQTRAEYLEMRKKRGSKSQSNNDFILRQIELVLQSGQEMPDIGLLSSLEDNEEL